MARVMLLLLPLKEERKEDAMRVLLT